MSEGEARLTIQDIARLAGVSRSTASRVLTNHPRVSATARLAVERVVSETGYRRNLLARSLVLGRSSVVAAVVPSISIVFYANILRGIESVLAGEFSLIIVSTEDDPELEREALDQLNAARVAGLVISTFRHQTQDCFPPQMPVVFVNRAPKMPRHSVVTSDNFRGGYLATSLLLRHGHRKVGHIGGSLALPTSHQRHEGYLKAMRDAGSEPRAEWSQACGLEMESGMDAGTKLIENATEVTGVITDGDLIAVGVMESLWQAGLSIPHHMSIVGYDDLAYAALTPISLSSVRTPQQLMGEIAGRLIKEAIHSGQPAEPRDIILPVELVTRSSVGPPRRQPRLQPRPQLRSTVPGG